MNDTINNTVRMDNRAISHCIHDVEYNDIINTTERVLEVDEHRKLTDSFIVQYSHNGLLSLITAAISYRVYFLSHPLVV